MQNIIFGVLLSHFNTKTNGMQCQKQKYGIYFANMRKKFYSRRVEGHSTKAT